MQLERLQRREGSTRCHALPVPQPTEEGSAHGGKPQLPGGHRLWDDQAYSQGRGETTGERQCQDRLTSVTSGQTGKGDQNGRLRQLLRKAQVKELPGMGLPMLQVPQAESLGWHQELQEAGTATTSRGRATFLRQRMGQQRPRQPARPRQMRLRPERKLRPQR